MFKKILVSEKKQNESLLKNLVLMANKGGNISEPELKAIFEIGVDKGLTKEEIIEIIADENATELFIPSTTDEKLGQIYNLVKVMLADGIIEDHEMEFCTGMAEAFGYRKTISALLVLSMSEYLQKGLEKHIVITLSKSYILKSQS